MKLDEFVHSTLVGVLKGVRAANAEIQGEKRPEDTAKTFLVGASSATKHLAFDIAVTARRQGEVSASADSDIFIASVDIDGKASASNENVTRIKFTVEINGFAG